LESQAFKQQEEANKHKINQPQNTEQFFTPMGGARRDQFTLTLTKVPNGVLKMKDLHHERVDPRKRSS